MCQHNRHGLPRVRHFSSPTTPDIVFIYLPIEPQWFWLPRASRQAQLPCASRPVGLFAVEHAHPGMTSWILTIVLIGALGSK